MDDALASAGEVEVGDAELVRISAEFADHGVGERVGEGLLPFIGGNDVIDGGEGAVGKPDLESEVAKHAEGLWAGDFVDEVGTNEQLGLTIAQRAHGVRVPDFFEQTFPHDDDGVGDWWTERVAQEWEGGEESGVGSRESGVGS